ncbi:MAG: hypothetical protein D6B25_08835 [Desulfobulbaceae bacterium]|nr:MAG: hypothetical protein D6B25_08835 [Desulfobulbaceae bacterium]
MKPFYIKTLIVSYLSLVFLPPLLAAEKTPLPVQLTTPNVHTTAPPDLNPSGNLTPGAPAPAPGVSNGLSENQQTQEPVAPLPKEISPKVAPVEKITPTQTPTLKKQPPPEKTTPTKTLKKNPVQPRTVSPKVTTLRRATDIDLSITKIEKSDAGPKQNTIAIVVKATPRNGFNPPMQTFPVRLLEGNKKVWEGRGRVKRTSFGWGDRVVTTYRVDESRYIALRAEVNLTNMNRRYPEARNRLANNISTQPFKPQRVARLTAANNAKPTAQRTIQKPPQNKALVKSAATPSKTTSTVARIDPKKAPLAREQIQSRQGTATVEIKAQTKIEPFDPLEGDQTNRVPTMGGGGIPGRTTVADLENPVLNERNPNLPAIDPEVTDRLSDDHWGIYWGELEIIEVKKLPSGPNRGKIAVTVGARKVWHDRPRAKPFRVELRNGSELLWTGTGMVKNMLVGWGDYIITDFTPREPMLLETTINPRPRDGNYAGYYKEYDNQRGNKKLTPFNWQTGSSPGSVTRRVVLEPEGLEEDTNYPPHIRNIQQLAEGENWNRVRVYYDLSPVFEERGNRCRIYAWGNPTGVGGGPFPDYEGQDHEVMCSNGFGQASTSFGRNQHQEFTCTTNLFTYGGEPFWARVRTYIKCEGDGGGANSNHYQSSNNKYWVPRARQADPIGPTIDEESDLFVPYASIEYSRSDGRPRVLRLNVSNGRNIGMTQVPVEVEIVNAGRLVETRRFTLPNVGLPVNPRAGIKLLRLDGSGLDWAEVEDARLHNSWINITIDPDHQLVESNKKNNRFQVNVTGFYPRR